MKKLLLATLGLFVAASAFAETRKITDQGSIISWEADSAEVSVSETYQINPKSNVAVFVHLKDAADTVDLFLVEIGTHGIWTSIDSSTALEGVFEVTFTLTPTPVLADEIRFTATNDDGTALADVARIVGYFITTER